MAKKYDYVPGNNPFEDRGNDGYLISRIDLGMAKEPFTRGDEQFDGSKHEVYMPRPRVADHETVESLDQECQSFWGDSGGLQSVIDAAIAQLFTRPNYKAHTADKGSVEEMHEAAIALAADYQMGRKAAPGVAAQTKKKASAFDALQKQADELGMSLEDIIEFAKSQG